MRLFSFAPVSSVSLIVALTTTTVGCGSMNVNEDAIGDGTDEESVDELEGESEDEYQNDGDGDFEGCFEDEDCGEGLACFDYYCMTPLPTVTNCVGFSPTTFEVTSVAYPHAFALGDVDGQLGDEIVVYQQGSVLSVAGGVELTTTEHPVPLAGVHDAVVLRADADASPDLWVADADGFLEFIGDGTGTFNYLGGQDLEIQLFELAKATGPFIDSIVGRAEPPGSYSQHQVFVDPFAEAPTLTIPINAEPLAGDFDGDGIDELLFIDYTLEIWGRVFETYELMTTIDCSLNSYFGTGVAIGDFDGDGLDDVVCMWSSDTPDRFALELWTSVDGLEFAAHPAVFVWGGHLPKRPIGVVADLEGDDEPELVFGTSGTSRFVRLGDDGNFGCQGSVGATGPFDVGDLDGDGRDELVNLEADDILRTYTFE